MEDGVCYVNFFIVSGLAKFLCESKWPQPFLNFQAEQFSVIH